MNTKAKKLLMSVFSIRVVWLNKWSLSHLHVQLPWLQSLQTDDFLHYYDYFLYSSKLNLVISLLGLSCDAGIAQVSYLVYGISNNSLHDQGMDNIVKWENT